MTAKLDEALLTGGMPPQPGGYSVPPALSALSLAKANIEPQP